MCCSRLIRMIREPVETVISDLSFLPVRERDMELFNGRPADVKERLPREIRTYDFLDQLGIPYSRTDHEAATNMEACEEIDRVLDVVMCKNLFLCNRQKTKFYLLLMPGDKKFKTKELSSQIGAARLSFAGPEGLLLEQYQLNTCQYLKGAVITVRFELSASSLCWHFGDPRF